jgi:hypothetical protein
VLDGIFEQEGNAEEEEDNPDLYQQVAAGEEVPDGRKDGLAPRRSRFAQLLLEDKALIVDRGRLRTGRRARRALSETT